MPRTALAPDVDFAALRGFHAVARTGSFSRAAALLRVQQPAVSKMVRGLEKRLGMTLLARNSRGVQPTGEGALLLEACERLFEEARALDDIVRQKAARPSGELFVAASDHVATYLLPGALEAVMRECPELVVRVVTGAAHLFLPGLADGRPELGLFFKLPATPMLDRTVVARAPCQVLVRSGLEHDETVLRSFIGSREVDDLSNKAFPTVRMLDGHRPGTRITASCSSLEAHKALLRRGAGVSILPLFMVRSELSRGELCVVHPEYVFEAELELVARRGARLSRAGGVFVRALRRELRSLGLA
jgi:DNA-binding transcriptional LysR family regulator